MFLIDRIDEEIAKKQEVLNLTSIDLKDSCLQYVVEQPHQHVTVLLLSMNDLTSKSMMFLSLGMWSQMIELNLRNKISSQGCKYLSRMDLPNLKNLYLSDNTIDSNGLKHLSKGRLIKLQKLALSANPIGEGAFTFLSKMDGRTMKDMRFGIKYLPRNDLFEHELRKIVYCDWPQLKQLRLRNHLDDSRKENLNLILLQKFASFMCIDHFDI